MYKTMVKKMSKKMTQGLMALAVVLLVVYALKVQGLVEFNEGKGMVKEGEGSVGDAKKSKKCKCTAEREKLDIVKKCYPTFVKCMGK
jgi:hypothetical protein